MLLPKSHVKVGQRLEDKSDNTVLVVQLSNDVDNVDACCLCVRLKADRAASAGPIGCLAEAGIGRMHVTEMSPWTCSLFHSANRAL